MSKKNAPAKQAKEVKAIKTVAKSPIGKKALSTKAVKAPRSGKTVVAEKIVKASGLKSKTVVSKSNAAKLGKDIKTLAKAATPAIADTPVKFSAVGDTQPFKLGGVIHIKLGTQAVALHGVAAKRNGSFVASRADLAKAKIVKIRAAELVSFNLK